MKDNITVSELETRRERDGYHDLLTAIRREFAENIRDGEEQLFTTDASGLYDILLAHLPEELRQYYTCSTCREFVRRYGGLVRIDPKTGAQYPVLWGREAPPLFADAVHAIRKQVKNAKVTGVFYTSQSCLGKPVTGVWIHMSVDVPQKMLLKDCLRSVPQAVATKAALQAEEHRLLCESVERYSMETAEEAVNLLRSNTLYRSERVLGAAEWFLEVLHSIQSGNTYNILWHRAATAPAGFCHIPDSMIGTLLDDLKAGLSLELVSRRFAAKMHPLQYQRPQAAPGAGNVKRAEEIVEKLGLANSLKRRFARLEELETLWKPSQPVRTGGVFADVETKEQRQRSMREPVVTMTWEKFRRTVLPTAKRIQFRVSGKRESFSAIVTAEDPSAPPIVRWDREDHRCPFNWYVYHNGSYPKDWGLKTGYVDVTAVVLQPNLWQSGYEYAGKSVFFILKDAKDMTYQTSGIALFPEVLRPELYEVRSTIEAYSKKNILSGFEEASACGLRLQGDLQWKDIAFRVAADVGTAVYELDRWD